MQTSGTDFNAFDAMAAGYDSSFTLTRVGKMQRDQVWHHLKKVIKKHSTLDILELNCGTGHDAIRFALDGHRLTATDSSHEMIAVCREKCGEISFNRPPEFIQCPFSDIGQRFKEKKFDLIFSNFGGLNCIAPAEIMALQQEMHSLLKPGGICIMVIMGTQCIWERLYFSLKGKRREALRRKSEMPVMAKAGSILIRTWYHPPRRIRKIFELCFAGMFHKPIGLFVPPSYLNPFFEKHNRLLGMLGFLDKLFGSIALFSNFADHYLIAFQKKETASKEIAD